jgi:RNA polymerase sigma factor (sigma-70 family)
MKSTEELLEEAQAGVDEAMNLLLEAFEPMNQSIGRRIASTVPACIDDVTQAARRGTYAAIRKFAPKEGGVSLGTLAYRYAHRFARDEFRRPSAALLATSTEWSDEDEGPESERIPSEELSPEAMVADRNLSRRLYDILNESDELDALDREIFTRRLVRSDLDKDSLKSIGAPHGLCGERIRQREAELREALPTVLASLRSSI